MKEKNTLFHQELWKRLLKLFVITSLGALAFWMLITPFLWLITPNIFNLKENIWDGILMGEFNFWSVLGVKISLWIWMICEGIAIFLTLRFAIWDSSIIRKTTTNVDADIQKLKSDESFKKIGYSGTLGKPHTNPGIVLATKGIKGKGSQGWSETDMKVSVDPTSHTILIGPTGSGKSQICNIPSIIHNAATIDEKNPKQIKQGFFKRILNKLFGFGKNSKAKKGASRIAPTILVVDVKGELYDETAAYAAGKGYKVHSFDTNHGGESFSFNPLYQIHEYWLKGYKEGIDTKEGSKWYSLAIEMLGNSISNILEVEQNDKGDAFWKHGEVKMLTGLIALAFDMYDAGKLKREQVSLATIHELSTNTNRMVEFAKEYGKSKYYELFLTQTINAFDADPNARAESSILMGMQNKIRIFDTYKRLTSRDDFHLINDYDKNIIYLKVPDHEPASYKLATLFIEQFYVSQVNKANKRADKRAVRNVKVIWDELTNCPKVGSLATMVKMGRSRGFQFFFSIQDQASLQSKYGREDASTILENCFAKVFFRLTTNDAKYASGLVGQRDAKVNVAFDANGAEANKISKGERYTDILRFDEIQDFRIMTVDKSGITDSLVITPRTKALVPNIGWYTVKDEICGGYDPFKFDLVETYYNKGSEKWDSLWKEKLKFADEAKKGWDQSAWRKEAIQQWKRENASLDPEDPEVISKMKMDIDSQKKKFMEERGMIPQISEVKKELANSLEEDGIFTLERAENKKKIQFKEHELLGLNMTVQETATDLYNKFKEVMPSYYKSKKYDEEFNKNFKAHFAKSNKSVGYATNGIPILIRLLSEAKVNGIFKSNMGHFKSLTANVKLLQDSFGIEENVLLEKTDIFNDIIKWMKSSNLKHKIPSDANGLAPTSVYVFATNGTWKIRVSDHENPKKGNTNDCDAEIIYSSDWTLEEFIKVWKETIEEVITTS